MAILLAVATALAVVRRNGQSCGDVAELPFTALEGDELSGSFSPDGREVVFIWAKKNENADIYLKAIDSEAVRPFVTSGAEDPFGNRHARHFDNAQAVHVTTHRS